MTWAHQSEGAEVVVDEDEWKMLVALTSDVKMEHKQCEGASPAKGTEETGRAGSPRGLNEGVGEGSAQWTG